jgi:hypothetical protein
MEPSVVLNQDGSVPDLTDTYDLLDACLLATGQDYNISDTIKGDVLPPMRNLQWFGARAPEELSRILQWIGGVHLTAPLRSPRRFHRCR